MRNAKNADKSTKKKKAKKADRTYDKVEKLSAERPDRGTEISVKKGKRKKKNLDISVPKAAPPKDDHLPDAWKTQLSPQAERAFDAFVTYYSGLGVQGLRNEFANVKTYVPPVFEYSAFSANPEKNRYRDVVCLDSTRVTLTLLVPPECPYIHANKVKLEGAEKSFITSQGPLENTIGDHWRMAHQENVSVIAALCQFVEGGKAKCAQYWPDKQDEFVTYGKMAVNTKKVVKEADFDVYTVEALPEGCSNSTIVKLIHMTSWPDRGVPKDPKVLLCLIKHIYFNAQGSVMVHCSAGIGRTGCVVAVDCVISRLVKGRETRIIDVFKDLRTQRASSVQTEAQYIFIVQAVLDFINTRTAAKYSEALAKFNDDFAKANLA